MKILPKLFIDMLVTYAQAVESPLIKYVVTITAEKVSFEAHF
jgi:hypothetical protein